MGPEDGSRTGKRKVRGLCGPDGARRSIAMTSGAVSSEYGESQVSARKTGVMGLNVQGTGANLGRRAVNIPSLSGAVLRVGKTCDRRFVTLSAVEGGPPSR